MAVITKLRTENEGNDMTMEMVVHMPAPNKDGYIEMADKSFSAKVEDGRVEVSIEGSFFDTQPIRYQEELRQYDLYEVLAITVNEALEGRSEPIPEYYHQYLNERYDEIYQNAQEHQQKTADHILNDAALMNDFKTMFDEDTFRAAHPDVSPQQYNNTLQAVAEEIANFYLDFTDEVEINAEEIVEYAYKVGTPQMLQAYAEDIENWKKSFEGELSHEELQAADDVLKFLTPVEQSEKSLSVVFHRDMTEITDSLQMGNYEPVAAVFFPNGSQAILEANSELVVTFEGEIYNFKDDFPQELKDIIASGNARNDERVSVEVSGFTLHYTDSEGHIAMDVSPERMTPEALYELLAQSIEELSDNRVEMPQNVFSITDGNGNYLQPDNSFGSEETRSIFFYENAAELVLQELNETKPENYTMITELPQEISVEYGYEKKSVEQTRESASKPKKPSKVDIELD